MSISRLIAIVFIFGCVTMAWAILATSVVVRTDPNGLNATLYRQVEKLWGTTHLQKAPAVTLVTQDGSTSNVELESSEIDVGLKLKHRPKGLLWYATYDVDFDGTYTFLNPLDEPVTATVTFEFPATSPAWDNFEFRVQDVHATPKGNTGNKLTATVELPPKKEADIHISYKSRGMDKWIYSFADSITAVKNFHLTVNTDFGGYDFPEGTISPSEKYKTESGWELAWNFTSLVSDFDVGVTMPTKINPGPLASRMSYFAPVSLLFFFTVLVVLGAVRDDTSLHPMHYFFLGASFFSFHLLFAYLVDHVMLEIAFIISAVVSLALVIGYLWRVVGWRFALREAGISQFLFLILFSYAFFFEGYTGLVVTIGAILTLAALMQITAKVDWAEVFKKKEKAPRQRPLVPIEQSPPTHYHSD
ncbi:MAG: inner membrane CreD family protein [Anaerolineae bacterium]|nr:inner membrane CreD family protein [Anaerolineae bacterium]